MMTEQGAVREPGQGVVQRRLLELLHRLGRDALAFADVGDHAADEENSVLAPSLGALLVAQLP